jgi:hypothetical protein
MIHCEYVFFCRDPIYRVRDLSKALQLLQIFSLMSVDKSWTDKSGPYRK